MELLFDDMWLDRRAGVRRVLGVPRKDPRPILQAEAPWERFVQAHHAVLFDEEEKKFKLWYRATLTGESGRGRTFLCLAESHDGVRWTRPSLGLFEFSGSRDNNIILEIAEGDSVFWNILKDARDPDPARRYKAIGFDRSGVAGGRGVCVAYSPDGIRWPEGPKLVMSTSDLTDSDCILGCREPTTGKWVGFFRPRTHPKRRFIGHSESDDFERWTYPRMLLTPDVLDDEWTEFYGLTVACVGRWRVGCLWVYHNNPECSPMTNELVYSRDGLHYLRAMPRMQFLPLGADGSFDSRMIATSAVIQRGGEFLIYYTGWNAEHGSDRGMEMQPPRVVPGEDRQSAICLARIAGLNFCGVRADYDGMVETKWLCNYGQSGVRGFAEIEKDGWIRAEILDQYGSVIPGWDRSTCRVRRGEDGQLLFCWGGDDLVGAYNQVSPAQGPIGHVVKLRFHLHKATLYAFQIGDEDITPA